MKRDTKEQIKGFVLCLEIIALFMLVPILARACRDWRPATAEPDSDLFAQAVQVIHHRESRSGADPRCRQTGPCGEIGEYQMTPIWLADCARLGIDVDPLDNESCRRAIRAWLAYYAPRLGAETPEHMAELYRRGPSGYRRKDVRHED